LLKVPLAGFFDNCGELYERLFRLVFPIQKLMNVNSIIGLDTTLVERSARLVPRRGNTITLLCEKQNIMLIGKFATFGCSRS